MKYWTLTYVFIKNNKEVTLPLTSKCLIEDILNVFNETIDYVFTYSERTQKHYFNERQLREFEWYDYLTIDHFDALREIEKFIST